MLPRTGAGLPAWRRGVAPWLMAGFRLAVAAFAIRFQVHVTTQATAFAELAAGAVERWALAATLVAGALLFAWPRTYLVGAAVLLAGLGWFEWLWHRLGMSGGPSLAYAAALILVLAAGEWLVRRLQRRLYADGGR